MDAALLVIHSLLRWLVLLTGLLAVGRGVVGWGGRPWTGADGRMARAYVVALDVQFLVGLVLYIALLVTAGSTITSIGDVMRDSNRRFFLVEHPLGMIIAVALAHIGNARLRKQLETRRHQTAAVFFGLSLLVILLSIPWPFMRVGRPLWPW